MKNVLAATILIVALLFNSATLCLAQPSTRFPQSITIMQEGQRYQGFDLGSFRELLSIDLDLQITLQELELQQQLVEQLRIESIDLAESLRLTEDSVRVLSEDRDRLLLQWTEQNRRLHDCENTPKIGPVIGWVLTGILAVSSGATIVAVRVSR